MNILGNMGKGIWNNVEKDVWKYMFFDKANIYVCVYTYNMTWYNEIWLGNFYAYNE